jgi:carbon monoxide dehydrogenase subunit G
MKLRGEELIGSARIRVWEALNDPEVLRQCIPGCQSLQRDTDNTLRATVEIKIGPIGARFNTVIVISDIVPMESYTIAAEGQGGTVGSGKSTIRVRLDDAGLQTRLSYEVDAQVGGRLAQLGGPLIDATAKQLAAKFFKRLGEIIGGTAVKTQGTNPSSAVPEAQSAKPALVTSDSRSSASPGSAWILALVVAALVGFLVGRGQSGASGSDWMGLSIGLLIVIVAAAGFEYGRRASAPQIVLDAELLQRLARGKDQ